MYGSGIGYFAHKAIVSENGNAPQRDSVPLAVDLGHMLQDGVRSLGGAVRTYLEAAAGAITPVYGGHVPLVMDGYERPGCPGCQTVSEPALAKAKGYGGHMISRVGGGGHHSQTWSTSKARQHEGFSSRNGRRR